MPTCLTLTDFEELRSGLLDKEAAERAREHIDACDACRVAYERHQADQEFLVGARSALGGESVSLRGAVSDSEDDLRSPGRRKASTRFPSIEGYRITGVLGQGGMGIVYRAVQVKLNRTVALKVLPAMVGAASPATVSRFRREALAAARLHHTHIVPIYDSGESPDAHFYAMELIAGQPLNVVVKRFAQKHAASATPARLTELLLSITTQGAGGPPTIAHLGMSGDESGSAVDVSIVGRARHYYMQVASWMADAADALHYAHGQGIIHRDVKPANLIVSTEGQIMITDFGLAKSAGEDSVTLTGSLLGTIRYLSPEQAMARRVPVDHRTDIYSLGATMYELLCFQPAFPGSDDKQVLSAIITRDATPARKISSSVPSELEIICHKALEKAPEARYSTARAFAEDLRRFTQNLPIEAKRPTPVARAGKFVRRHKAGVIATAACVLVVIASPLLMYMNSLRVEADRRRVEAERLGAEARAMEFLDEAHILQGVGRWADAAAAYEDALALNPNHFATWNNYAKMKKDQYNASLVPDRQLLRDAASHSAKALAIKQDDPRVWNTNGVVRKKLGEYAEAIASYDKAIELDETFAEAWENLSVANALAGNLDKAEEALLHTAELAGTALSCETIWCSLTSLRLLRGGSELGDLIDRAFQCNPDNPWSAIIRARVRLGFEGQLDLAGALDDAKFAVRRVENPAVKSPAKLARARRMLALAYLQNEDFELAAQQARGAIEAGDLETINELIVAITEAKQGRVADARNTIDQALRHWPEDLTIKGDVRVEAPEGILWFETANELLSLRAEAEQIITATNP